MPPTVRTSIEQLLGSAVTEAVSQPGGFSPGVASRLLLGDGRRVFLKLVSADANPDTPEIHRQEARIVAALPPLMFVPALLDVYDDGTWVGLVFEDIAGRQPLLPWHEAELERVVDAIGELASVLTPSPVQVPSFADDPIGGDSFGRLSSNPHDEGLDPWIARHLGALADLESGYAEAAAGRTLVHADIRADNVLLTRDRVVFVDWPWACTGAAWLDLLCFCPSVAMQGGPPPWEVFASGSRGLRPEPEAVQALVALLAGFFINRSLEPDPPGLPTVRAFQAAQGVRAVRWLRHLTGWR